MSNDLMLRRKWTFRAHGRQVVFVKRPNERSSHVFMKAFLWALYLPTYPNLSVEIAIGDRYKPDVVELTADGTPLFWGEAGEVGVAKIRSLVHRYRTTHFAIARWDSRLGPLSEIVERALTNQGRTAPFDLLCFAADSAERFISADGEIDLSHADLEWRRIEPLS